ncbi:EAL domain-containing protein [Pseudomonas panipatensis]|uniref:cyclic-guanylate-specific phosphodiesterase n=1 Tax=Pseudomonas panipatensis TaxID=428992 RepID=A0A1G8LWF1_9PSED|nr:EAL domain-containing protein [Pseudomonas panipatensis]SDI59988.1 PAS domain S-box-containing protein/diguanylate cyclase (GGDEF) domain-containing protein [Pseudomonas panipatensis]SMP47474.1 diguanylate cyclase/phosphodiesterase with PAS/PAC sensor(s) [Pseudomonas panipatensis]
MTDYQTPDVVLQTLEQAIDGVVVLDEDGRVVLFNAAAERLWGYGRDEVLGRDVGLLLPTDVRSRLDTPRSTDAIIGSRSEVPMQRRDGSRRWGSMSISRIEVGGKCFLTAFIKDCTLQRQQREQMDVLSLAANETDNAVIVTDHDGCILYVNGGFSRMFGWTRAQAVGHYPSELLQVPKASAARWRLAGAGLFRGEELVRDLHGHPLWCSVVANPIFDTRGKPTHSVMLLTDITRTKMHEVLQNKVLEALVREEPLVQVMDLVCREVERIAPEVKASILRVDEQGRVHPLAAPSLPQAYSQALEGVLIGPSAGSCGTAAYRGEPVLVSDIARDPLWADYRHLALPLGLLACWSSPIKNSDGRVVGTFAFYYQQCRGPDELHQRLVDLSLHLCALALEREAARAHIRQLAFYDTLTGLPNRALLLAEAEQAIARVEAEDAELAVLFIDLDRFKQINDSLGHPAGDELLRVVAARLQEVVREQGIVGRLSGDEFVVVLPHCGSLLAAQIAERILQRLAIPHSVSGVGLITLASVGISLFPCNGQDMESLLHRADMAMYQAKNSERGSFRFFSEEMNRRAQERMALESALREALANGGLSLHYQPQVRLDDDRVHAVEALARWHHPWLGTIPPNRFIPLAEECGLIGELSQWVLAEACRQLADWRHRAIDVPAVAVNLSPPDFHDPTLPQRIQALLQRHGLSGADLVVEITEGLLLDNNPLTRDTLGAVDALGVRLSLDDFGTGYSSLSYLHHLPISEMKLDRSFVSDLRAGSAAEALTRAVMNIGRSLELMVIAEGVEDEQQLALLREQGCPVAQGYLFSRPLPAGGLEEWLRQRR